MILQNLLSPSLTQKQFRSSYQHIYQSASTSNSETQFEDPILLNNKILTQNYHLDSLQSNCHNLVNPQLINNVNKQKYLDCTKEKSELCKTFVQMGYCPYNNKCKFAHGSHQLRQNLSFNSRYKTKQCGSYFKKLFCIYGNRCNFVHQKQENGNCKEQKQRLKWKNILETNRQIVYECRRQSRLLKILKMEEQH